MSGGNRSNGTPTSGAALCVALAMAVCTGPLSAAPARAAGESRAGKWAVRGALTFGYATATAVAFVAHDQEAGRDIATWAGAVGGGLMGGAALGGIAGWAVCHGCSGADNARAKIVGGTVAIAGAIAGGVLGGLAAHAAPPECEGTNCGCGLCTPLRSGHRIDLPVTVAGDGLPAEVSWVTLARVSPLWGYIRSIACCCPTADSSSA